MEIFIDESGSFVGKNAPENSWCSVVAFVCPDKNGFRDALLCLKGEENIPSEREMKINEISSEEYLLDFLYRLYAAGGVVFCVVTDSSANKERDILNHRNKQVELIKENIDKMRYEGGRSGVIYLTEQIQQMPPQLYIQLYSQVYLLKDLIYRGVSYFVHRYPSILSSFVWEFDQKSPDKITNYEDAFQKIAPALLQTMSIEKPAIILKWCDYSYMHDYMYSLSDTPDYLAEIVPSSLQNQGGLDVQKIVRGNINFVDSKESEGVQVADLLASVIRKVLRQEFQDNEAIAEALGRLLVQNYKEKPPLSLLAFGNTRKVSSHVKKVVNIMKVHSRKFVFRVD